jgi:hypothetical protein
VFRTSQAVQHQLAIGLTAVVLASSCSRSDFYPVLDIPLAPATGHTRSPPFSIDSNSVYAIGVGTEGGMEVDEATCRAATYMPGITEKTERAGYKVPPCHMLTPAIGAFTWKVSHDGKLVATGSQPGMPPLPLHTTMPEKITWQFFSTFHAEAGKDYVVEVDLPPSNIPLERFHPRLEIMKTFK